MRKKLIALVSAAMVLGCFMFGSTAVINADDTVNLSSFNCATADFSNTISPKFRLVNNSGETVNLSDIEVRYYYTSDGMTGEHLYCDYSGMNGTSGYTALTAKVTGEFVYVNDVRTPHTYAAIGFTEEAGNFLPGSVIEIQTRIVNEKWANYDQTNDYSFDADSKTYAENEQIALYIKGKLISGMPQGFGDSPLADSETTITYAEFDTATQSDENLVIPVSFNGNDLVEIKVNDKAINKDYYTADEDAALISPLYLCNLEGEYEIRLIFSYGNDSVVTVKVYDSSKPIVYDPEISVGECEISSEKIYVPIKLTHAGDGINNMDMKIAFDNTKLIAKSVKTEDILVVDGFGYSIDNEKGIIKVLYIDMTQTGAEKISEDGAMFKIEFTALGTGSAEIALQNVNVCNGNLEEVKTDIVNGNIIL